MAAGVQEQGGADVDVLLFHGGHRFLDGVADGLVDEAECGSGGASSPSRCSPLAASSRPVSSSPASRAREFGVGALVEDGQGLGEFAYGRGLGAQGDGEPLAQGGQALGADGGGLCGHGFAGARQRGEGGGEEHGVAAGDVVAGRHIGGVGGPAEACRHEFGDAGAGQRGGPQDVGRAVGDVVQTRLLRARVALADGDDNGDAQVGEPFGEVAQPAQGGRVGPLEVVDEDQQGSAGAAVGDEREPVAVRVALGRVEGCPGEQGGSRSWLTTPKGKSCSSRAPLAERTWVPRRSAMAGRARSRAVLPMPMPPVTTSRAPRAPRAAPPPAWRG
ncbi:hypothetical protein GCM10020000_08440 [Streptomyces olivoverticillatus]